jgi:hypothetical protein
MRPEIPFCGLRNDVSYADSLQKHRSTYQQVLVLTRDLNRVPYVVEGKGWELAEIERRAVGGVVVGVFRVGLDRDCSGLSPSLKDLLSRIGSLSDYET